MNLMYVFLTLALAIGLILWFTLGNNKELATSTATMCNVNWQRQRARLRRQGYNHTNCSGDWLGGCGTCTGVD